MASQTSFLALKAAIEEMSAQVEQVTACALSLAEMAQRLEEIINRFKINQVILSTSGL